MIAFLLLLIPPPSILHAQPAPLTDCVLELDGTNTFVELLPKLFTNRVDRVEGWVKWREFGHTSRFFEFADASHQIAVPNSGPSNTLWFQRWARPPFGDQRTTGVPEVLSPGERQHIAAVAGTNGVRLYLNGVPVATAEAPSNWTPDRPPPLKTFSAGAS